MTDLELLKARAEIVDLRNRYATGIDQLDRDVFRSCFTDPVEIDFPTRRGTMTVDSWVDSVWANVVGLDATQHTITNHRITFHDDDSATCVSYLVAQSVQHGDPTLTLTVGGFYTDEVVRTPTGWRIRNCALTYIWQTGETDLLALGRRAGPRREAR